MCWSDYVFKLCFAKFLRWTIYFGNTQQCLTFLKRATHKTRFKKYSDLTGRIGWVRLSMSRHLDLDMGVWTDEYCGKRNNCWGIGGPNGKDTSSRIDI